MVPYHSFIPPSRLLSFPCQSVVALGTAGPGVKNICRAVVLKFLLTKLFFKLSFVKILMPQSCAVASDESFVGFLYNNELYRKTPYFYKHEEVFLFCKYLIEMFWLLRKTPRKQKNKVYLNVFLCHH